MKKDVLLIGGLVLLIVISACDKKETQDNQVVQEIEQEVEIETQTTEDEEFTFSPNSIVETKDNISLSLDDFEYEIKGENWGKIVNNLKDLSKDDLGDAGTVEERKVGDDEFTYIMDCKNPKAVTLLIRGGTEHVTNEIERAVTDAVGDVAAALKTGMVVAGAGAPEIELSMALKRYANSLSGREQLAVEAFADAMEIIPRTLVENAGLDPIDTMTELKAAHSKKQKWAGIDVFSGKVMDAWKRGVIEPLKIKTQAVSSAAEVAVMILRIDDVIQSSGSKEPAGPPGGMPPGMGGMPGMM